MFNVNKDMNDHGFVFYKLRDIVFVDICDIGENQITFYKWMP